MQWRSHFPYKSSRTNIKPAVPPGTRAVTRPSWIPCQDWARIIGPHTRTVWRRGVTEEELVRFKRAEHSHMSSSTIQKRCDLFHVLREAAVRQKSQSFLPPIHGNWIFPFGTSRQMFSSNISRFCWPSLFHRFIPYQCHYHHNSPSLFPHRISGTVESWFLMHAEQILTQPLPPSIQTVNSITFCTPSFLYQLMWISISPILAGNSLKNLYLLNADNCLSSSQPNVNLSPESSK